MMTRVGVGYSEESVSFEAGARAARQAHDRLDGRTCDVALLFTTSAHDSAEVARGVRSVIGAQARLMGGFAVGVITNDELGYDGHQVGIALFDLDGARVDLFQEGPLAGNEQAVGETLGRRIVETVRDGERHTLLLYDSVNRTDGRFRLNMATPLLKGLEEHLSEADMAHLVGAGLVGDMACRPTWQWFDDDLEQQTAMAMVASGGLTMHSTIIHGCRPASDYRTVTKSDGPAVLEIDGRPALEVVAEMLGADSDISWKDYSFFVTLGVNKGEKYGPFREEDYANRLCLRADEKRKALVMFEPDLVPGSEIQLMRRSIDFSYIEQRVGDLLDNLPQDKQPVFAFYIDCAGRAAAYSGADEEEAAAVMERLGPDIPLLGIYSGVEIGQVRGRAQPLDWTGVLAVFCA